MTPQKPYLIRAIFEWLLDNECTPYLLVNTYYEGVQVPAEYIKDNRIVLNISPDAVKDLNMDNDWISFSARFAGKAMNLFIPIVAVQAIYSKENNEGMYFPDEDNPTPPSVPTPPDGNKARPSLKVVK